MKDSINYSEEFSGSLPASLARELLDWYDSNRRILPWREDPTPYHVWVSEIMLQQTRVETVIPYYMRFTEELPDVSTLAAVPEERLLKLWEGLGYYSRVRNMQKAAIQIMTEYGGKLPSDPVLLSKLPGIGEYTAAAIASIAFRVKVPSVDGNLLRVYARLTAYRDDIRTSSAKKLAEKAFFEAMPEGRPGDMNQGLMDLGATVCLPNGAPVCEKCPFAGSCKAHSFGLENDIPKPGEKAVKPVDKKTVFLIRFGNDILLHRRNKKGLLAGMDEFPNTDGELSEEAASRFCSSLGFYCCSVKSLKTAKHVFSHRIWEMNGFEIRIADPSGNALPSGYRFVSLDTLHLDIAVPSAFSAFMKHLDLLQG